MFQENTSHELVDATDAAQLPIGSIVWPWKHGRIDGSPLVVIAGGRLTQIALLPERAGGGEPGGDPAHLWGSEFVVVTEGSGRLPTHGTAQRAAIAWQRDTQRAHTPNASAAVYYVWVLDYRGVPLDGEGPYGPMSLEKAAQFARIGATKGDHDRAVSIGRDPESQGFEILRRYRRGTGERML